MPRRKKSSPVSKTPPKRTASQMRDSYQKIKEEQEKANFAKAEAGLQKLVDPTKNLTRSFTADTKKTLRDYLKRPTTYYKQLRGLSRYLYYRSQLYRRLIIYNASMINLEFRSIIPMIDMNKKTDMKKVVKSFYETARAVDKMNLPLEFYKAYLIAWRDDVFFGCAYHDDTGFFILPLDADFCKVTSIYPNGDLGFDMDMSYFSTRQEQLELWGEPFASMYKEYEKDRTNGKWQPMPDEHCVCLKVNIDDWELPLPPYMGLFDSLINLEDLSDIMAIAEKQGIDKLLVAQLPTIKSSNVVDDFSVDPKTAAAYFNKMSQTLPDYVGAILTPVPIESVSFNRDQSTDVNKLQNATKSVLTISGGVQTLCPPEGTTAYTAAIRSDEEYAISSLLPQTQAILNRLLSYKIKNPAKVKLLEITRYTKDAYKAELIKDMNYGAPHIFTLSSLAGFSELETVSLAKLQDAMGIRELFKPLQTAATQSAQDQKGDAGRPENDADEPLSDAGERSKDRKEADAKP